VSRDLCLRLNSRFSPQLQTLSHLRDARREREEGDDAVDNGVRRESALRSVEVEVRGGRGRHRVQSVARFLLLKRTNRRPKSGISRALRCGQSEERAARLQSALTMK
jgi:hypothetical protein